MDTLQIKKGATLEIHKDFLEHHMNSNSQYGIKS